MIGTRKGLAPYVLAPWRQSSLVRATAAAQQQAYQRPIAKDDNALAILRRSKTTGSLSPWRSNGATGLSPWRSNGATGLSPWRSNGATGLSPWRSNGATGLSPWRSNGAGSLSPWRSNGATGLSPWMSNGATGLSPWRSNGATGLSPWRSYGTSTSRSLPQDVTSVLNDDITTTEKFEKLYKLTKELFESKKLPKDVNLSGVFACNELDLTEVQVYGFDYDYTLACYKPNLHDLLYNLGRDVLIKQFKYPSEIAKLEYIPGFAVRGLHYDIEKGLLLKLDSFLQIQLGSVYRGLTKIPDDEVLKLYKNRILPIAYVEGQSKNHQLNLKSKMVQLADLFSVPEMCLLCNVAEYFERNHIDYNPEILFHDIKSSVQSCHPMMHQIVIRNAEEYIHKNPKLPEYLDKLVKAGKKLFLVTNSPFAFVDRGMQLLAGKHWRDYFDLIIVQARKPKFFTDESRPIRIYDENTNTHLWDRVSSLEKGKIYYEGTVKQLQDLTGWRGHSVLYFGDHPYSDLADVTLEHGWRTGAIISELTHEINTLNKQTFKQNANWLQMLTQLIEDNQDNESLAAQQCLRKWMTERDELRNKTKMVFNEQFGSVFRTYHNPTYFSRRLFRFADIYTSDITNLSNFSIAHTFYPRRGVMPHEYISYFM